MTPIHVLMDYLVKNNKVMNIKFREGIMKGECISHYQIDNDQLYMMTEKNNELWLDISKFKKVQFDAIVYDAATASEMERCLEILDDVKNYQRFNAYLQDDNGKYIADFLFICDEQNRLVQMKRY